MSTTNFESVNRKRRMTDEHEPSNKKWALYLSNACSEEVAKCLVDGADESTLVTTLKAVEANISLIPNNQLLSHTFLYAIVCLLERYKLNGEAQLLLNSRKILQIICQNFHEERRKLAEMGIMNILSDIMINEAEKQMNSHVWNETDESVTLLHIIAGFLPVPNNVIFRDSTSSYDEFLFTGPDALQTTREEIENMLEIVIPRLFKISQTPHCPIYYTNALLKTIYWAEDILSDLVKVEELIRYAKNLIDTNPIREDNIVLGFEIIWNLYKYNFTQLLNERISEFLKVKKSILWPWCRNEPDKTIFYFYTYMTTFWLKEDTIRNFQIDEQNLNPRIETINSTLNSIMPDIDDGKPSPMSLNTKYNNLRRQVKDILNLPDISRHKGKLTASPEGIRRFQDLITFIVKTVDALIIHKDFFVVTSDLSDNEDLPVPESPTDIKLELYWSASFDRVLGSSQSPEELRTDPLVRALRLLSILYEVNENWGILFCSLSTERLIDRNCFISEVLKEVMYRTNDEELNYIPIKMYNYAEKYPFLMLKEHRDNLLETKIFEKVDRIHPESNVRISIPRIITFHAFATLLDSVVDKSDSKWDFRFQGEIGMGHGTNKEFYTEFSHDCQRFRHGLWSGEVSDGVSYVKSQSGLFPHPKSMSNPMAKSYLNAIGVVMARALVDDHKLDINFSHAFYKCLFKKNRDAQQLSLVDIKDVMPSTFRFVESLVDALREKWCVRMDNSLTIEEQNQAVSNITCDGCSFEDLCVNFTLPSFPDIEMMEGGSETFLSIENIETYLKLLIWWLLYETPQKCIKEVRNGFEKILDPTFFTLLYFYPHEYEELFCGLTKELWTVDILKQNCVLEGLSIESPVIQYLFEVLSSLSTSDQRHFLEFVTATPRLPVGGLIAFNPKLTIRLRAADGDPDNYLPTSFTCFNTLLITAYSCKEALAEKLLLAIREGRNTFSFS